MKPKGNSQSAYKMFAINIVWLSKQVHFNTWTMKFPCYIALVCNYFVRRERVDVCVRMALIPILLDEDTKEILCLVRTKQPWLFKCSRWTSSHSNFIELCALFSVAPPSIDIMQTFSLKWQKFFQTKTLTVFCILLWKIHRLNQSFSHFNRFINWTF